MGVSDASILASEVDMAILVIQYRKYPQAMTIRAKQMVEKVVATCSGWCSTTSTFLKILTTTTTVVTTITIRSRTIQRGWFVCLA